MVKLIDEMNVMDSLGGTELLCAASRDDAELSPIEIAAALYQG